MSNLVIKKISYCFFMLKTVDLDFLTSMKNLEHDIDSKHLTSLRVNSLHFIFLFFWSYMTTMLHFKIDFNL